MLLQELDSFSAQSGLGVNLVSSLDESLLSSRGLQVVGEQTSAFSDDGSSLLVFSHLLFEFFVLLGSLGIQLVSGLVVGSQLSFLGLDDSFVDFLQGIQFSLELGFKGDSQSVAVGQILIEG